MLCLFLHYILIYLASDHIKNSFDILINVSDKTIISLFQRKSISLFKVLNSKIF